ncbi:type II secretion system inner membrane protein GspF [Desulfosudis oleivorans]|uniref:General secretion pathway protein F n=1 Tax=Desulfosudis oleivorans (strain DSM 6200 / JCM 39069 / Hxd3) TaxID=96561 RepID=A8ZWZ9_DESOH|nr:type II secretion system inner membrane protein GspF [Desulfosudis oleivorans]ABW66855.1 general secretion pathway protein F [Desulfosudis oleivorans Hxd3]
MPVYEYSALNAGGKTVSGIIDADGETAAREKLRGQQLFPVAIAEAYDRREQKAGGRWPEGLRLFSGIGKGELATATRQLATLVGSGFPLVSAIYTLIPQAGSAALKKALSRIKESVEEGNSFADALAGFPDIFSPIYINMVRAGEASGTLEVVLERLADLQETQQAQRNRITAILAYPLVMTVLGSGVLVFLLVKIVPQLVSVFEDMNQVLPVPTRIVIATSDFLQSYWWVLLAAGVALFLALQKFRKTRRGRHLLDTALLRVPGLKSLVQKIAVARFSRTLGSLLENGIPMLTALDIVKNIVGNTIIADAVTAAATDVEKGEGLGSSLEITGVFPHLSVQMIKVGEQSGNIEQMLQRTADVFENEVDAALVGLTSLLEPLLVISMGIVIGFIVLSIILPIFEMYQFAG